MNAVTPHIVAAPVKLDEIEPDAADWFGRHKATPEVIARANAEWAAMDWRGRLPAGWVNPVSGDIAALAERIDRTLREIG